MEPSLWKRKPLNPANDDIRLAILLPNSDIRATPECRLATISLNDGVPYEAISYVWGNEEDTVDMILGDGHSSSRHRITRNLDSCLRHIRLKHNIHFLWIDAIYIDQTDDEEKETQIVLMRHIYRKAQRVCVFLGEGSPETELALSIIVAITRSKSFASAFIGGRRLVPSDLRYLQAFTASPWWDRIWVVQEAWLNTNVNFFTGSEGISMTTLRTFAEVWRSELESWSEETRAFFLQSDEDLPSNLFSLIAFPITQLLNIGSQYLLKQLRGVDRDEDDSFLRILAICRARKAKKAQDKVYGLLGLCSQLFSDSFPPDLRLQPAQVYRNFAFAYLSHTRNLSLFNQCALEPISEHILPSWVPDLAISSRSLAYNADRLDLQHFYQAGILHPLHFKLLGERTLYLEGVSVDVVSCVGEKNILYDENTNQTYDPNDAAIFREWEAIAGVTKFKGKAARYIAGGASNDAYWKTLFSDIMLPKTSMIAGARRCKGSDRYQYVAWISQVNADPPI